MTKPRTAVASSVRAERIARLNFLIARASEERLKMGHRGGRKPKALRETWILCWKRELRALERGAPVLVSTGDRNLVVHESNPLGIESIEKVAS